MPQKKPDKKAGQGQFFLSGCPRTGQAASVKLYVRYLIRPYTYDYKSSDKQIQLNK